MIKKSIFYIFLFFSFLLCGYGTYRMFFIPEGDIAPKASPSEIQKKSPTELIYQKRKDVQKDVFFTQNGQRFHFKIFSENSEVKLKNKKELVEDLENIVCLTQDKIFFDHEKQTTMQQLRYFTAKTGTYKYPSHKFTTDSINLSLFEIPGSELPNNLIGINPYLKGIAKEVSFSVIDKMPKLSAQHFKATMDYDTAISNFEKDIR